MAWSVAEGSTLTGLESAATTERICISKAQLIKRSAKVQSVTQSGDIQTYNTPASSVKTRQELASSTRLVYTLAGTGWYEVYSGGSWNGVIVESNMASISNARISKVDMAQIERKMLTVKELTSTDDAAPDTIFSANKPEYSGRVSGHLESTETPMDDEPNATPSTLTLPLGSGTVVGSAYIDTENQNINYEAGGEFPFSSDFRLSGAVTVTATPFDIVSFTATLDLDNGQTASGTCLLLRMAAQLDYKKGGPVPFRYQGLFTGGVTFA